MYLTSLRVENIKLFADQEFSFVGADGRPRLWTAVIGDNGVCKTTLLQLVALAASGEKMASRLAETAEQYRAADNAGVAARFSATFALVAKGPPSIRSTLTAEPKRIDWQGADQANYFDQTRGLVAHGGDFVAGYGVGRYLPRPGEVAVPAVPVLDRIGGLFNPRHKMLGVDFFEALGKRDPSLARSYAKRVREVLIAEDSSGDKLLPWLATEELRGPRGPKNVVELLRSRVFQVTIGERMMVLGPSALSQGYQSMVAWLTDLLGHAFLEFGDVDPALLEGVVLLDEIDLHLHPTWQRRIVPILRQVFPRLQFIVTTHSPLALTGFARDEIIRLGIEDGKVVQREVTTEPGLRTGSELLGDFFGVPRAARPELVKLEREYASLAGRRRRSGGEEARLQELSEILHGFSADTELPLPPVARQAVAEPEPEDSGQTGGLGA